MSQGSTIFYESGRSNSKLVLTWILGTIFLFAGVWILQNLEFGPGVTHFSYALAALVAFILFLLCGLCWIAVAVATRSGVR
jgi:hypothetical protein